jgi:hypothetical protein
MYLLVYPLLLGVVLLPDPGPRARVLEDFARIDRAVGDSIYVVDRDGNERFGRLVGLDDQALRLQIGAQLFSMDRTTILAADSRRDRTTDGVLKGLLFGLVTGLIARQGTSGGADATGVVVGSMAFYGGLGWAFDRANSSRSPLYRAPAPAASVTVRF